MGWSSMVDMRRSEEEKRDDMMPMAAESQPDLPYGLCITFTERELEKLDLDDDVEEGDLLDIRAFARVTSVTKHSADGKRCCRVEMGLEQLAVENETTEEPGEDPDD